ncbi:ABC transporter permease [Allosediminivita pacifica]|uniref:Capsular polysaccharide transport system permease protein n=1 Tax=Allosediminivita pacifica TaxID=1267769 RepID=A0A2T6B5L7_9RHOB|nr:ABC transporter permease [Allosediminivita pacifica]PTX51354.1 capsular polysaccharide transport system permease protein [Allosediminivita pacifica]GGA99120.1 transport permease protein [Allosediminivita pacifica]
MEPQRLNHPGRLRSVHHQVPRAATLRTVFALILREMSTTYGRSPGGYLWAVAEPALGIALMVWLFSIGFRSPPLGSNFAIFYATGLLPFFFFLMIANKVQTAIQFSKQLLAYPRVTFMDALIARFGLAVLTNAMVSYILFLMILGLYDTRTVLDLGAVLNGYAMAATFGFGVGVLNSLLTAQSPLWGNIWGVVSRPLFLISGVIILPESIPEPYRGWLEWNPLVHVTGEVRRGFYYSYTADYVNPLFVYGTALLLTAVGLLFLRSYHRDLLER